MIRTDVYVMMGSSQRLQDLQAGPKGRLQQVLDRRAVQQSTVRPAQDDAVHSGYVTERRNGWQAEHGKASCSTSTNISSETDDNFK